MVAFVGGESTPDTIRLSRHKSVFETIGEDGTLGTEFFSHVRGLFPELSIGDVFREVDLWKPLARYHPDCLNFEHEVGVWVSGVEHIVETIEGSRNVQY